MVKTKIVCTIGPSCWDKDTLKKIIKAGMDVARLNFSHGDHQSHEEVFKRIRETAEELCEPVAIMQDLCGPKIRLGIIPGDGFILEEGQLIKLTGEEIDCTPERLSVSYKFLSKDLKPGEPVLIDDGLVSLQVREISGEDVICQVAVGGIVKSNKGVNLPGSTLSISALTEKDIDDARFGCRLGVDYMALSFVRKAADVLHLKKILEEEKKIIPIITKIEKQEAVNNLDEILNVADGAMVARGDLGVEVPYHQVPLIQKELIKKCNLLSKPVVTATQMLDSMIRNPMPTRAEVTDIANAILDGTDAVMLSGETASGKYPVESVTAMNRIAQTTEMHLETLPNPDYPSHHNVVDSISEATCKIAEELNAKGIMILTDSGRTARLVSRYKPDAPVIAITYNIETVRRLNLSWGVFPLLVEPTTNTDKMLGNATDAALASGIVKPGDLIVTTAGIPAMVKGSTNMIKVDILGRVFLRGTGVGPKSKVTASICIANNAEEAKTCLQTGDILVTRRLDESFLDINEKPAGIITEEGTDGSYADFFCQKFNIPGVLSVPGARKAFVSGQIMTLESDRGIIYCAKK